jgi:hypothetical protein
MVCLDHSPTLHRRSISYLLLHGKGSSRSARAGRNRGWGMLVLGYAKSTAVDGPEITVPPFHTGHLGFVPETPAWVGLVAAPTKGRHCEVIVTPFEQEVRYLAHVSVAMRDEVGVVARLIAAVASLGINIEVQESSSINLLDHHYVSLLVDLSEASVAPRTEFSSPASIPETPTAVRRLYRGYDSLFPVQDLRFVRLFEAIVTHCADVIVWKEVSGEYLPDINIHGFSERPLSKRGIVSLAKGDRALQVKFKMPTTITSRLKQVLGERDDFQYLLVSDTTTRTLHVFFLHPGLASKLFHVGFPHDDVPGALATILALLRDAKFNILTSLVRKQQDGRSVWEAVLEYQGDSEVPPSESRPAHSPITQGELKWIGERIVGAHDRGGRQMPDYGIEVAPPDYPARPRGSRVRKYSLRGELGPADCDREVVQSPSQKSLLQQQRRALAKRDLHPRVALKSTQLLDVVDRRSAEGERPGVFLSYPGSARKYGRALHRRLATRYRVEEYQEPDGEVIVDEVIRKIEGSDYFVGIWHHEGKVKAGERTKEISPWMLFEYGVARAAEKPALVVHSNKVDQNVRRRIDPSVSHLEYTPSKFERDTVEWIWDYCERHFG